LPFSSQHRAAWFYISGLMLLLGAEIDRVIDEAAAEERLSSLAASSLERQSGAGTSI
jgi:uncharacterized BrkB/YihY/UPF0761 family membrane protein